MPASPEQLARLRQWAVALSPQHPPAVAALAVLADLDALRLERDRLLAELAAAGRLVDELTAAVGRLRFELAEEKAAHTATLDRHERQAEQVRAGLLLRLGSLEARCDEQVSEVARRQAEAARLREVVEAQRELLRDALLVLPGDTGIITRARVSVAIEKHLDEAS